jgi:6-phosphogluconolactonase
MMAASSLKIYGTVEDLQRSVAAMLVDVVRQSVSDRGVCILALSGGETPRPIYRQLGSPPLRERIEWERVHLLFGDERMVPTGDPRSNSLLVEEELFSRITMPPQNVHRIAGEKEPAVAAKEYENDLRELLSNGQKRIDCVLLGLGEDGHTASLFPGSSVLRERNALVMPVYHQQSNVWRVTMTFPLINAARMVVFVVAGKEKAKVMHRVSQAREPSENLPASMVRPIKGKLVWMIDREAASELSPFRNSRSGSA